MVAIRVSNVLLFLLYVIGLIILEEIVFSNNDVAARLISIGLLGMTRFMPPNYLLFVVFSCAELTVLFNLERKQHCSLQGS